MSENDDKNVVSLAESETPLCVTSFKIKVVYALKLAQQSTCSPRKKRHAISEHAIFRLIKALVMLLHVRK